MSAELSFIPIESENVNENIDRVIALIKQSGLQYQVGIISTSVTGEKKRMLQLISEIATKMDLICGYRFDVKISNVCGCNLKK